MRDEVPEPGHLVYSSSYGWGDQPMQVRDIATGNVAAPVYIDEKTGKTIDPETFSLRSVRQH